MACRVPTTVPVFVPCLCLRSAVAPSTTPLPTPFRFPHPYIPAAAQLRVSVLPPRRYRPLLRPIPTAALPPPPPSMLLLHNLRPPPNTIPPSLPRVLRLPPHVVLCLGSLLRGALLARSSAVVFVADSIALSANVTACCALPPKSPCVPSKPIVCFLVAYSQYAPTAASSYWLPADPLSTLLRIPPAPSRCPQTASNRTSCTQWGAPRALTASTGSWRTLPGACCRTRSSWRASRSAPTCSKRRLPRTNGRWRRGL